MTSLARGDNFAKLLCVVKYVWADQSEETGGALKKQELKQSILDQGGLQCCGTGQYKKTEVFFDH